MREAYRKLGVILLMTLWLGALTPVLIAQRHLSDEDQCVSRMRMLSTAMLMYLQDYDEVFPWRSDATRWATGCGAMRTLCPTIGGRPAPSREAAFASMWANAILPYLSFRGGAPRYDLLHCPATIATKIADSNYANPRRRPAKVSYTYNGLLHRLSLGQSDNPATVPALWEGRGRTYLVGYALSNPTLRCDKSFVLSAATIRPHGMAIAELAVLCLLSDSVWIHSKGTVMAYMDGHVGWRRLGLVVAPNNTDPNYDPFTGYNALRACRPTTGSTAVIRGSSARTECG
jgi:prepilin-type processing-associated H-X9-DG protein